MAEYKFKTVKIRGKEYVQVSERLKYFRTQDRYKDWSIETELIDVQPTEITMRAVIRDESGRIRATGFAHEKEAASPINKFSMYECGETSCWGRALANLGIGLEKGIASADEIKNVPKLKEEEDTPSESAPATQTDKNVQEPKEELQEPKETITDQMITKITALIFDLGCTEEAICENMGCSNLTDMTYENGIKCIKILENMKAKKKLKANKNG